MTPSDHDDAGDAPGTDATGPGDAPADVPRGLGDAPAGTAWVAFDPGWRVGVAWVDADGGLLHHTIVEPDGVAGVPIPVGAGILLGDGTGSDGVAASLQARGRDITVVDEEGTSLIARRLYFERYPASGWRRLLPSGLRLPPVPIDDLAAWAIARRYLGLEPGSTG